MSESSARARQVLAESDQIVAKERRLTVHLLERLHEIEQNKFYLELGYSSMFDYCTGRLKYSEPAAIRRIRTARCLAQHPQLREALEAGEVSMTTVAMISYHTAPENAAAAFSAIRGRSKREVEQIIAALEPLSTVPPDRVRPVVVPVPTCAKSTSSSDGKKSCSVEGLTPSSDENHEPQTMQPQFERRARVEFTAREELMAKLERIRSVMSHRLPRNAPLDELFYFMADHILQREDPEARHARRQARNAKGGGMVAPATPGKSRQVSAPVRDQVFVRDARCTYVGPDGKRCNSTHVLQVDHIQPVARGGGATVDNLRLLCAYHNRLESERLMGKRNNRSG